jgi:hypothetical protein
MTITDRRATPRVTLPPMYTSVLVHRNRDMTIETLDGHAYDVSEGGARVELDEALPPGEPVSVAIRLPGGAGEIVASGVVAWANDREDDPGPCRMALRFTRFFAERDRARLVRHVESSRRAA